MSLSLSLFLSLVAWKLRKPPAPSPFPTHLRFLQVSSPFMRSSLPGSFRHTHLFSRSLLFLFSSFSDVFGCRCSLFLLLLSLLSFQVTTFNLPSNNACLGLRLFVCLFVCCGDFSRGVSLLEIVCCGDLRGVSLHSTGSSCKVLFPSSMDPLKLLLQCVSCG
jgi:hypothetical protein